ncbi:MAG: RNA polymerase sigma factor [Planctomycetota bacterium]
MSDIESRLADAAASGDRGACRALYQRHAPRVKVYLLRSGFAAADADDLLQEIFLRVFRSIETYDPERGRFGTWLGAIARNAARKQWGRRRSETPVDPELAEAVFSDDGEPESTIEQFERDEAIRACIGALPEALGRIALLRYVEGYTTRAIAEESGIPESTVRLRIDQAHKQLEACLQSKGVL